MDATLSIQLKAAQTVPNHSIWNVVLSKTSHRIRTFSWSSTSSANTLHLCYLKVTRSEGRATLWSLAALQASKYAAAWLRFRDKRHLSPFLAARLWNSPPLPAKCFAGQVTDQLKHFQFVQWTRRVRQETYPTQAGVAFVWLWVNRFSLIASVGTFNWLDCSYL